ncbi:hypothetical protein RJ639_029201 [Escallonia herrerae]|uniref:Bifunctional inhibitor/plant lipid transfer protein/seed storage helical domain-containing protein n=1 Tax=Escallonia herrerae TaxID=1293975 RepID=A0AA88X6I9_9ASTE|nr:hypothetical protein RJ639_029201 [Escallonia herrerae]
MAEKMRVQLLVVLLVVVCGGVGAATLGERCSKVFEKVTTCLTFATGKAATPTKDCCSSVTGIRESDPACLCYIIQQIHNGSNPQIKSFGIQEARLLQLPSACKLANASISDCPRLLNIPPGSPDIAIFSNSSSTATPTAPTTFTPSTSTPDGSGFKPGTQLAGSILIVVAVLFFASPA